MGIAPAPAPRNYGARQSMGVPMINRVRIKNYRAILSVDVELDRFNVLIGPNASGKTTFLDALVFARDVIALDLPGACFGGARSRCTHPSELTWQQYGGRIEIEIEFNNRLMPDNKFWCDKLKYSLHVSTTPELDVITDAVSLDYEAPRSLVAAAASNVRGFLSEHTLVYAPSPSAMRRPSAAYWDILPDASNLPWIVDRLEREAPERMVAWRDHVCTSLQDVVKITTKAREEDGARYIELTHSSGLALPAWLLSDGTLRFLALTILPYMKLPPSIIIIENIEQSMHPQMIEPLLQSLTSIYDSQVLCTSYSPVVQALTDTKSILCFSVKSRFGVSIARCSEQPWMAIV